MTELKGYASTNKPYGLPEWSQDYLYAERGQLTLFDLSLDDLISGSEKTEAELMEWRRVGLLSFAPDPLGKYRQHHSDEVRFISEVIDMTGSVKETQEILAGLEPPYAYDVNTTFYHLGNRQWRQVLPMPDPAELIEENLNEYIYNLDETRLMDLLETIEERMQELKLE